MGHDSFWKAIGDSVYEWWMSKIWLAEYGPYWREALEQEKAARQAAERIAPETPAPIRFPRRSPSGLPSDVNPKYHAYSLESIIG